MSFALRHRRRPSRPWNEGSAAVEFALAVPILMMLVLLAADYALFCNQQISLMAATRGAAEYARSHTTASGSTVAAYGNFPAGVTPTVSTFCTCADNSSVNCTGGTCSVSGDTRVMQYVQVSASRNFTPLFSYGGFPLSQVSASTALRVQ